MLKKMNLQLLADTPDGQGSVETVETNTESKAEEVKFTPEQLSEIDRIASERSQRAQNSALKSYFEQQGLSQEQAEKALASYKEEQKKNDPAIVVKEMETKVKTANRRVVETEAKIAALELGARTDRIDSILKLAELPDEPDAEATKKAIEKVMSSYPEWKQEDKKAFKFGEAKPDASKPEKPTIRSAIAERMKLGG
jgi:hypothetical protein